MKRNAVILQLPQAPQQSMASLLNWVNSTGSIVREETAFLHGKDLCAVGGWKDHGVAWIESLIEQILVYVHQSIIRMRLLDFQHQLPSHPEAGQNNLSSATATHSKHLFLFEGFAMRLMTHLCITLLIVLLLLIPMIAMQAISSATIQMVCIMLMSVLFTIVMSGPIHARTAEIFGPSATYRQPDAHNSDLLLKCPSDTSRCWRFSLPQTVIIS